MCDFHALVTPSTVKRTSNISNLWAECGQTTQMGGARLSRTHRSDRNRAVSKPASAAAQRPLLRPKTALRPQPGETHTHTSVGAPPPPPPPALVERGERRPRETPNTMTFSNKLLPFWRENRRRLDPLGCSVNFAILKVAMRSERRVHRVQNWVKKARKCAEAGSVWPGSPAGTGGGWKPVPGVSATLVGLGLPGNGGKNVARRQRRGRTAQLCVNTCRKA